MLPLIRPQWPASSHIRAVCTTRQGGVSIDPYASLNLGLHVGDNPRAVMRNRELLLQQLNIPQPIWLTQTHTSNVYVDTGSNPSTEPNADASITTHPRRPLVILTGDCLPILLAHRHAKAVAAIHAGWRGITRGVIQNTLANLPGNAKDYIAWIGPGISQSAYTVSRDFKATLCDINPLYRNAFKDTETGSIQADLNVIACCALQNSGIDHISLSGLCTHNDPRFFSYRRSKITGRIATLIWIDP